ncbi:hypothetical protein GCM10020219_052820 [Nonomuraea dietziae]
MPSAERGEGGDQSDGVSGWRRGHGNGRVRIWKPWTVSVEATLSGHDTTSTKRRRSRRTGNDWLANAGERRDRLRLWDDDGTEAGRLVLHGHEAPCGAWWIAPDGSWLVSCGRNEPMRAWSADVTCCGRWEHGRL